MTKKYKQLTKALRSKAGRISEAVFFNADFDDKNIDTANLLFIAADAIDYLSHKLYGGENDE